MVGPVLLVTDVDISVYNHSWRYGYQFTLDLLSPHELDQFVPLGATMDYSGSRSAWSWLGETSRTSSVDPHGVAVIRARLSCYTPGMIDIALWRLQASAFVPSSTPMMSDAAARSTPVLPFSSKSLDCVLYPTQPHFVRMGAE
ncbi:hypothetical protein EV174_006075 [Coemansia sp. RSA 2320]|nr:hypothetical protein EV174_006075 [Coemansia sp. RSA 2320]